MPSRPLPAARHALGVAIALLVTATALALPAAAHQPRLVRSWSGLTLYSPLGHSIANAGDVNGDGHDDLVMGAPDYFGGRVFVVFGGPYSDDLPDLTIVGPVFEDIGRAVAGAGDVNGDGYDDILVATSNSDAGGSGSGLVQLYFGGISPDATADLTIPGAAGEQLGFSVSGGGDVNADGYDDFMVGAPMGAGGLGRAYLYLGGAVPNAVADLTLTGLAVNDYFGAAVAIVGDYDRDGYDDIAVGARGNDAAGTSAGRVVVYRGRPTPDTSFMWSYTGAAGDELGSSVAGVGDVNGDGVDDLALGAQYGDAGVPGAGQVNVYFGEGDPYVSRINPDVILVGSASGEKFGECVARAGDVNGDGHDDIVVGSSYSSAGAYFGGKATVYFGGPAIDATPDLVAEGTQPDGRLGYSLATVGDLDGDGRDDFAASGIEENSFRNGFVHVWSAVAFDVLTPNGGEQWVAGSPQTVRWRGSSPADVWVSVDGGTSFSLVASNVGGNHDNALEIVVPSTITDGGLVRISANGEPLLHLSTDVSDAAFSIVEPHEPPKVVARPLVTATGAAAQDLFGRSASRAGDVNGDGHPDWIVGAPFNDGAGANAGRAYLYFGGPNADGTADLVLNGAAAGDQFGTSVAGAGDVNRDGYADVFVGAPAAASNGRAYLFLGGAAMDATADLTLTGAAAGDQFGFSVSGAGDVNRDGFADLLVGAPFQDGVFADGGRAYLYLGGLAPDALADLTLAPQAAGDQFGISVTGFGDATGDGFADIAVGAQYHDAAGSNAGRVYVYFGGWPLNAVVDATLDGEAANDRFGRPVAEAGDVNGDGLADLVVGATQHATAPSSAGRAYVYFGRADGVYAGPIFSAIGTDDLFGFAASAAGDVNGDGYGDVLVGAPLGDAPGTDGGRTYLYFGGPGADGIADLTFSAAAAGDQFGYSACGVGDVTGDGFPDVLIGAQGNDAGGSDAGRVYLHDFDRYVLTSPNRGETWNVGAQETIAWLGAERADVWLSSDNGGSWDLLRSDVGGQASNLLQLRVPHVPSRFSRVRITPHDSEVRGLDESDSSFTIRTSIALLSLVAETGAEGTVLTWASEPAVGPQGIAGYRLYRIAPGGDDAGARLGPDLIETTRWVDETAAAGASYRLAAVNGFGAEVELGRITPAGAPGTLRAWPSPLGVGALRIELAAPMVAPGVFATDLEVSIFDLEGRRVATPARGSLPGRDGAVSLRWDPRAHGARAGVYFVRASAPSAGYRAEKRIVVMP